MRKARTIGLLAMLAMGLLAVPAQADDPYLLSIGFLGGAGGPLDADPPDPGLSQQSLDDRVCRCRRHHGRAAWPVVRRDAI